MDPWRRRTLFTLPAVLAAQACSPLRALNAAPQPGVRLRARDVAYAQGRRRSLDVYARHDAHKSPVLLFLYGGGWEGGRKEDYGFAGRAFASRGFVTLVPDYRLTWDAPYPAFLQDCAAAVAWAARHAAAYGGDPGRIVLAGRSAGAYNAAMLALDGRWLAGAGAPGAVRAWAGLSGPYDFLPLAPGFAARTFGAVEDLPSTQPITYVRPGAPPAFLAAGDRDDVVSPGNTVRLATRLKGAGTRVTLRIYPGIGHAELVLALALPLRFRVKVLRDASDFLMAALAG